MQPKHIKLTTNTQKAPQSLPGMQSGLHEGPLVLPAGGRPASDLCTLTSDNVGAAVGASMRAVSVMAKRAAHDGMAVGVGGLPLSMAHA